jgi:ubiquinone/menaquinone biosynthesis C-methylase UbiE
MGTATLFVLIAVFAAVAMIAIGLGWRYASRRRSLPCPAWLFPVLVNRVTEPIGARILPSLDRIQLSPGMRVLDAGCGTGRLTLPAAEAVGPNGLVVALDLQPAVLEKLRQRAKARGLTNIRTVAGGIGQGVVEENAFDRALLMTVLGEIPERHRVLALREIYAALKPGGILSITEAIEPHYQTRDTVRRLAEAVGFRLDRQYGSWLAFTMNFAKGHAGPGSR